MPAFDKSKLPYVSKYSVKIGLLFLSLFLYYSNKQKIILIHGMPHNYILLKLKTADYVYPLVPYTQNEITG